jgi:hypothetical protein
MMCAEEEPEDDTLGARSPPNIVQNDELDYMSQLINSKSSRIQNSSKE